MLRSLLGRAVGFSLLATAVSVVAGPLVNAAENARLGAFQKGTGETYFALSLMPGATADPNQVNEVVVLFDTSASQAGAFREDALAALRGMLSGLGPRDHVNLIAVDVKAVAMMNGYVAPTGEEMNAALVKLQQRTPLGATDLGLGLTKALESLEGTPGARSVIYFGDGQSKANPLIREGYASLVNSLVENRVSVSAFATGRERNVPLLAALANQTGGNLLLDGSGNNPGARLAGIVRAGVIWPTKATLPAAFTEAFPNKLPPLRTDRDTILIGRLEGAGEQPVEVAGELNGKPVELSWKPAVEKPSDDFAFLPQLIDLAKGDGGITLPTVGSGGLRETAAVTFASAESLARLGENALAAGNVDGARKVADAILARDPASPAGRALKRAAATSTAGTRPAVPARSSEPELKLGTVSAGGSGSLFEELEREGASALADAEALSVVRAKKFQAEVQNVLRMARDQMASDPTGVIQGLKLKMEDIEKAGDILPELRAQLRDQVDSALREARRRELEVAEIRARAQEQEAFAREQQRVLEALALKEMKMQQIMDRFTSLIAERNYRAAEYEVLPEIRRLSPNSTVSEVATYSGRAMRAYREMEQISELRNKNMVETMLQVERAHIPFPDEPPIVYVAAEKWEDLTLRRKKYKAVDLARSGSSEERIFTALNDTAQIEFIETPLKDVISYLQDVHNIPIILNQKKLDEVGVTSDTPVTKTLKGITLRSALRMILKDLELTYVIRDEVLQITTPEDAESKLITKVYPVGDLVVPIMPAGFGLSGMSGGGIGMGGMGMNGQGMGGGMGGGGMGMGGMGMGGMGGMGGGGGFFAVEDVFSLRHKARGN